MSSTDGAGPLLRQVLDAPQRVVVLHGPAACGKTSAAIELYEHYSASPAGGRCLYLAPNFAQVAAVRGALLARSPSGVLVRPRLSTLAGLAGAIVGAEAGKPKRALSGFAAHLLLKEVVDELAAARRLGALAAVADTPGLVPALAGAIAELKRAAIEPDGLDRAVRAGAAARDKSHSLVDVYRLYQDRLRQGGAYDTEGLIWEARDRCQASDRRHASDRCHASGLPGRKHETSEGAREPASDHASASGSMAPSTVPLAPILDGISALVVDGFTDFGPTQLGILGLLARWMEKVLITLPLSLPEVHAEGRGRIWGTTLRTLEGLRRTFGRDLAEIEAAPSSRDRRHASGLPGRKHETVTETQESASDHASASGSMAPSMAPSAPSPLPRTLWDDLFGPEAPRRETPAGLEVIATGGAEAEVWAVAWRVKRLLRRGAPAGSIAVLARSLEAYRDHVERVFRRCDIPIRPSPVTLADVPIVRFLLDASQLAPLFEFGDVLRVIKSSYFRPAALGSFTAGTVATAEMLIRQGNVVGGRRAYAQAAARLAQSAALREEEEEETVSLGPLTASPERLAEAADMIEKLFTLVEGTGREEEAKTEETHGRDARDTHGQDAHATKAASAAGALAALSDALQLDEAATRSAGPEWIARDLRALAALRAALAEAGGKAAPSDIRQALSAIRCPGARGEGLVDVSDILDARAMRYRHVFLLGVAEGQFPQGFRENSLITERQRSAWARHGAELDQRRDFTCREMLLFYLAVSRAEETLTISFSESDAAGRPGAPSAMLLSLLEPLGGLDALERTGALHRIPRGEFLVADEQLACPADAVSAAVAGLFAPWHGQPARMGLAHVSQGHPQQGPVGPAPGCPSPASATEEEGEEKEEETTHGRDARDTHGRDAHATLQWAAAHRPGALRAAAWGLFARQRRWRQAPCDTYDGRLADPALVQSLAEQFGPQAVFSASQLNAFGQCPWRFFASYVLRLAPLEEPQRRLEPQTRGSMCHDVLQDVFTRLAKEFGLPVRLGPIDPDKVEQVLQDAMAEQSRRIDLRKPPYPALWKILQSQVLRQLRDYLEAQREALDLQPESLHFELAFGMKEGGAFGREDPASRAEPVAIETPAGTILLRGKIDRLDRISLDGEGRLFVVDYKTGALPKSADILEGRNVQIPLYAAAAEQLLGQPCMGGAFHGIGREVRQRWFAALKPARGGGSQANDDYPAQHRQVLDTVGRFVQAIRAGRFDLFPVHDCPGHCPFRRICQFSDARAEHKAALAGEAAP